MMHPEEAEYECRVLIKLTFRAKKIPKLCQSNRMLMCSLYRNLTEERDFGRKEGNVGNFG